MAHALGIVARGRCCSPARRRGARRPSSALVARREAGEPIAYITGRRAFWTIELEVGPGVLVPAAGQRDPDRGGGRAFRRSAARATILDLGTGPGTLLLAALDQWPEARGARRRRFGRRRSLMRGAMPSGSASPAAPSSGSATGREGLDGAVRSHPLQPALCRGRTPRCRATSPNGSRTRPCSPARTVSSNIAASPPPFAPLLAPGGIACVEIGARPGGGGVGAVRGARASRMESRSDLAGSPAASC